MKILHVHLLHHFQISYDKGRCTSEYVQTEHIPVLLIVIFKLHMYETSVPHRIKHVADKWKRRRARNLVTKGVFQSAKRCNAPEVNNKSYNRSNSDRLVLRKDLLEQAEEIHIWKKKIEVFLRQLVFKTDESARTSNLNPVYQIRHKKFPRRHCHREGYHAGPSRKICVKLRTQKKTQLQFVSFPSLLIITSLFSIFILIFFF